MNISVPRNHRDIMFALLQKELIINVYDIFVPNQPYDPSKEGYTLNRFNIGDIETSTKTFENVCHLGYIKSDLVIDENDQTVRGIDLAVKAGFYKCGLSNLGEKIIRSFSKRDLEKTGTVICRGVG